ncbi:MAG: N-acetylmuramoyl-L-alanine amidase [Bacteroidales bacterium]|nr:N-acetylmuramoyl-L-alanine amidase [Bacteroidales bacterium]MCD8395094.1 N-acetylmuramoyl-L-alanine amidase [Bacteroidales bacterium]
MSAPILRLTAAPRGWLVALTVFVLGCLAASSAETFTLVIDPGHGGKDYGAIGQLTNEKTINLNVAKLFGEKVKKGMKDVKVVYTRDTDRFISLKERADIANRAHGDLFVSIHVNSVDKKAKNRTTVKGASVYTLGLHKSDANLEVAKRENSVITLESDYSTVYQGFDPTSTESYIMFEISQNKHMEQSVAFASEVENQLVANAGRADKGVRQAGFWVLWATSMPSVLIELDFICNPDVEKFLHSKKGQEKLANGIYDAFCSYKASYDRSIGVTPTKPLTSAELGDDPVDDSLPARDATATETSADAREGRRTPAPTGDGQSDLTSSSKDKKKKDKKKKAQKEAEKKEQEAKEQAARDEQAKQEQKAKKEQAKAATATDVTVYKVQFLTSNKLYEKGSRQFKGLYPVSYYKDKGVYKYTYGEARTWKEAEKILRKIKEKFPDAFITTFRGDRRVK